MAATVMFDPAYKGKKFLVITDSEAAKIRRQLFTGDVPNDLSEARYEFLRHIVRLFDPERLEQPQNASYDTDKFTNLGVQQGMASALPRNDQ